MKTMTDEILLVAGNDVVLSPEIADRIVEFERLAKDIKKKEDALKQAILEEMERCGIIKLDTPDLLITYVAATDRESLDSKALKAELPDIYDTYCRISAVKPSIRIKVRD